MAQDFMAGGYTWLELGRVGSTSRNITQRIVRTVNAQDKLEVLPDVLEEVEGQTLMFVNTKMCAEWLRQKLWEEYNVRAAPIHGDLSQFQRERALQHFRSGRVRVLIGTDVAARGWMSVA